VKQKKDKIQFKADCQGSLNIYVNKAHFCDSLHKQTQQQKQQLQRGR
jgi:hypothetical protein